MSARTIDELGLGDCVEFVTGVPEERIIELYSEAEVAVVPSLYEGFSLPAIEAMSCGVPLVATTGGALPEVVGADNETALLVPPGDSEALAATHRHRPRRRRAAGPDRRRRPPAGHRPLDLAPHRRGHGRALPGAAGRDRRHPEPPPRGALAAPRFRAAAHAEADLLAGAALVPARRTDRAHRRLRQARPPAGRPAARPGLRLRAPRVRGPPTRAPGWWPATWPPTELIETRSLFGAMATAGEIAPDSTGDVRQRRRHPAPVRRRHLRSHHRQRGDGAHPRRPGRRSTSSPGCSSPAA